MVIKKLFLKNFRNFKNFEVEFSQTKTLIVGPNGSGKSNILEAVYFLATGDAVKAQKDEEVIKFGESFAKIIGVCDGGNSEETTFDLTVELSPYGRFTKTAQINGVKRPLNKFLGVFRAVEFNPANLSLVSGPPDVRRRYLNSVLYQISRQYRESYGSYEKIRKQKNSLLTQIAEGMANPSQLDLWNEKLLEFGLLVQKARHEYFDHLRKDVTGIVFDYMVSVISKERLAAFKETEIAAGVSLIGPHRDDFEFLVPQGLNLAHFGSRGEQRMAVFELKLGEISYFKAKTGDRPVLLLDDIFSELDGDHRHEVLGRISSESTEQIVFTATDEEHVGSENLSGMKVIRL